jgi:hypothetical protein
LTWKFSVDPPRDLTNDAGPVHLFVDRCRKTKFAGSDVVIQVLSPAADARFQAGE